MNRCKGILAAAVAALAWPAAGTLAADGVTVECMSHGYGYNECYAPLEAPQLVYQSSSAACIINRSWGFNPATSRIWVTDGCAGVFADPSGYHHGQAGTVDQGARGYGHRGHDTGALIAGALIGALVEGAASSGHKHSTTNNYVYTQSTGSGYTGCHGVGCLVDDPDDSFVPSYDEPPEPGQTTFSDSYSDDAPPEPGETEFSGGSGDEDWE